MAETEQQDSTDQTSTPETTGSGSTGISQEVASALGLTPQDVERANKDRIEEERYQDTMQNRGMEYYKKMKSTRPDQYLEAVDVGFFTLKPGTLVASELPDKLMAEWGKGGDETPDKTKKVDGRLRSFLNGFGNASFQEGDWKAVVNAFDLASEGGGRESYRIKM